MVWKEERRYHKMEREGVVVVVMVLPETSVVGWVMQLLKGSVRERQHQGLRDV